MVGIVDGTPVDAATTNAALLASNGDDFTVGKLGLESPDGVDGYFVTSIQRYLNNIAQTIGLSYVANYSAEADSTGRDYNSTSNAVTNGDTTKASITKLSDKFANNTGDGGHNHDGTDGNGAPIAVAKLTGVKVGQTACVTGSDTVTVTFASPYPNTAYRATYAFHNEFDSPVMFLQGMTTAQTQFGFTVQMNTAPDSGNYLLDWQCLEDIDV